MNTLGIIIASEDPDFLILSRPVQNRLYCAVLTYMFKGSSSQEMSEEFKQVMGWSGKQCTSFRQRLKDSGELQLNVKLFLYSRICGYDTPAIMFEIKKEDATWVTRILRSQTEGIKALRKICLSFHRKGYKPIAFSKYRKAIDGLPAVLNEGLRKLVGKKLRFLWQSEQISQEGVVSDLFSAGLYSVYHAYPVIETPLHMANIARTAIHNRAMNIIAEQTTESRKRVVKNDDGTFSGVLLSINASVSPEMLYAQDNVGNGAAIVCNSLMSGLDGTSAEGESPWDVNRKRELRLTVENLVTSMPPKGRAFVHLMMGEYDEEFSQFLGQANTDVYAKAKREVYLDKARQFLEIPVPKAREFVVRLRDHLHEYRN